MRTGAWRLRTTAASIDTSAGGRGHGQQPAVSDVIDFDPGCDLIPPARSDGRDGDSLARPNVIPVADVARLLDGRGDLASGHTVLAPTALLQGYGRDRAPGDPILASNVMMPGADHWPDGHRFPQSNDTVGKFCRRVQEAADPDIDASLRGWRATRARPRDSRLAGNLGGLVPTWAWARLRVYVRRNQHRRLSWASSRRHPAGANG